MAAADRHPHMAADARRAIPRWRPEGCHAAPGAARSRRRAAPDTRIHVRRAAPAAHDDDSDVQRLGRPLQVAALRIDALERLRVLMRLGHVQPHQVEDEPIALAEVATPPVERDPDQPGAAPGQRHRELVLDAGGAEELLVEPQATVLHRAKNPTASRHCHRQSARSAPGSDGRPGCGRSDAVRRVTGRAGWRSPRPVACRCRSRPRQPCPKEPARGGAPSCAGESHREARGRTRRPRTRGSLACPPCEAAPSVAPTR